ALTLKIMHKTTIINVTKEWNTMLLYFLLCFFIQSTMFTYNKMHVHSALQASNNHKAFNASSCDFRGAGTLLQNINFANSQLSRANFSSNGPIVVAKPGTIQIANQITDLTK